MQKLYVETPLLESTPLTHLLGIPVFLKMEAALQFADDHRVLVEPACGAPLSLIYDQLSLLQKFSSILVIVCGGSGVTRTLLNTWQEKTE